MGRKRDRVIARNAGSPREDVASTTDMLAFTAAGAVGAAWLGSMLTRKGWEPKAVSGVLTIVGALLAGTTDNEFLRALGTGALGGSGARLVLLLFADDGKSRTQAPVGSTIGASPRIVEAVAA